MNRELTGRIHASRMLLIVSCVCGPVAVSAGPAQSDPLRSYFGPQAGKTYVYDVEEAGKGRISTTTVASVEGQDADSRVTCSPASVAEYPEDLRKRGAKPVISKVEIRDGAIISTRGGVNSILLHTPLRPGPDLWQKRQTAIMPDGSHRTTILSCGISEITNRKVLGSDRSTVTVQCAGKSSPGSVLTSSTYAEGLGLVEETTEVSDENLKPIGKYRQVLTEIRNGADACSALVKSHQAPPDQK